VKPNSVLEGLWDYGLDGLFAIRAGATAPQGWGPALVAEDLGLGLGASMLGRVMGDSIGRNIFKLDPVADAARLGNIRNAASIGLSMGPALMGFRPVTQKMIEEQELAYNEQQQLQEEEQKKHLQEQLINATMGGVGTTIGSALGGRDTWAAAAGALPMS
jgi:hypothetical protein